jgi:hypothetical protein
MRKMFYPIFDNFRVGSKRKMLEPRILQLHKAKVGVLIDLLRELRSIINTIDPPKKVSFLNLFKQ